MCVMGYLGHNLQRSCYHSREARSQGLSSALGMAVRKETLGTRLHSRLCIATKHLALCLISGSASRGAPILINLQVRLYQVLHVCTNTQRTNPHLRVSPLIKSKGLKSERSKDYINVLCRTDNIIF